MSAWVISDDALLASARLNVARSFIDLAEIKLSRFRPESELSRLNARAGRPVNVSALLWEVLEVALEASKETDGLYDPTVLDALESAGYRHTFDSIKDEDVPLSPLPETRSNWHDIIMDSLTQSVTLPSDVHIDLGGIAKGWAAKRAADYLSNLGPCLVNASGDIEVRGNPLGYEGWPIGISSPFHPDEDLLAVSVRDRGVATSGVDFRRWNGNGQEQHHIIDPSTKRPSKTDILTVTVIASNATQADLYALVTLLLGVENGYRYLVRLPDVEGLIVTRDAHMATTPGFDQYILSD